MIPFPLSRQCIFGKLEEIKVLLVRCYLNNWKVKKMCSTLRRESSDLTLKILSTNSLRVAWVPRHAMNFFPVHKVSGSSVYSAKGCNLQSFWLLGHSRSWIIDNRSPYLGPWPILTLSGLPAPDQTLNPSHPVFSPWPIFDSFRAAAPDHTPSLSKSVNGGSKSFFSVLGQFLTLLGCLSGRRVKCVRKLTGQPSISIAPR